MDTGEARSLYAQRKQTAELSFGILKEQMGARRLLLWGSANLKAEFLMLVTAFNPRALWRIWTTWVKTPVRPAPAGCHPSFVELISGTSKLVLPEAEAT